jgi:serine protease
VARGLIVELKPATPNPNQQTPQAMQAMHDQLASVAGMAGLPAPDAAPRRVGARGYLMRFNAPLQGAALDAAVQSVAANPAVQSVSPDVLMHRLDMTPNDPGFINGDQWYLRAPSDPAGGAAALNTPPAWDVTTGLASQVVAVVDSGALFNHADLASQFIAGYDFITDVAAGNTGLGRNPDASDPGDWVSLADLRNPALIALGCQPSDLGPSSWHGSFIAGIIGAASNNAIGVTGIDWNTKILPVRVAGKCGAYLSDVIDGLRWAAGAPVDGVPGNPTPARIINISLGSDQACVPAYQSAINDAVARGSLVVTAAGNTNAALGNPAGCSGVLAVGAVRQDGLKTFYSSFGAGMGLMAPGGAGEDALPNDVIWSASNTGARGPMQDDYADSVGTSFSAPMAAGVAALMLAANPSLTPAQLIALMQQSARPFPSNPNYPACGRGVNTACNCTPQTCGAGLLDANAAVQLALNASGGRNPGSTPPPPSTTSDDSDQGGGGATGWLWGLGLWGLAAAALWRRKVIAPPARRT